MAQVNSSTMEIGTSDQVLVGAKKKKGITLLIGSIAMVVVIGVVVALLVVFVGGEGAGDAQPIVGPTEGPSTIIVPSPTVPVPTEPTVTTTPLPPPTTEEPGPEEPLQPQEIDLQDIINGAFSGASFNGSWASGSEILFRNANGDLVLYNVDFGTPTNLVTNSSQILQQSSRVTQLSPDGTHVLLSYAVAPAKYSTEKQVAEHLVKVYRYSFLARYSTINISSGDEFHIVPPEVNATEAFLQNVVWGPNGTALAFVYMNNIFYQASLSEEPQQITSDGELNVVYHGTPDWVYEEEVFNSNNALWFSADGSKMAYVTFDDRNVGIMRVPHYGIPGSGNYQYTQHHQIRYPKSGTTNPTVSVTLRDLDQTGASTVYTAPTDLVEPILKTVTFVSSTSIAMMWTNRVQTTLRVVLCTQGTAACTEIYSYTQENGWVDNIPLIFNPAGNSFITILPSLVDGVLYKQVVQVSSGALAAPWSPAPRSAAPHTVADILKWTDDDVVWYKATGVSDSSEQHVYAVDAVGALRCFTCSVARADGGACLYNDAALSGDNQRLVVHCAGPSVPQVYIYDVNGTLVQTWDENAETLALISNRIVPESIRLSVPTAPGFPDADVMIQVPSDYANRTNVPLLVYVYGGPDTALVTQQWSVDWGSSLVSRWGVAVAHIDGRGSGLRGAHNTFALHRQLGSVEIQDQIAVTRHLQENLEWVDANRTCIWGWSYGGYAASLALARGGDVFRCAIAVAPVVDWTFYDTIYTERYMDTPSNNSEAYAASSLLNQDVVSAFRNKRYFLVHGTADDNVHYQHAMLISRLLQVNDVYFTQMSYTDEDHGLIGVRPHLYHSLEKFLKENML